MAGEEGGDVKVEKGFLEKLGGEGRERGGWKGWCDSGADEQAMLLVVVADLCRLICSEMVVAIRIFTLCECVCAVGDGGVGLCAECRLYVFDTV